MNSVIEARNLVKNFKKFRAVDDISFTVSRGETFAVLGENGARVQQIKMTKFRPCIDLHEGKVKQIVGGTLGNSLVTNSVSLNSPAFFAQLYKKHKRYITETR